MESEGSLSGKDARQNTGYNLTRIGQIGFLLLCSWLVFSYQGLASAIEIWYISEIFNHCFFVIPVSLYLIWEKRDTIPWEYQAISFLALPFIVGQVLLYLIGIAGDIQLFQHVALFALLPTLVWFYLGDKIAYHILFPLCFMLFAIPFGEEFIPFLQEVTADLSVIMVSWTGIPLFRSGLFLEIPEGRFLVAEACSGVSFLIASVVLGNLYSYMNLKLKVTKVFFVLLSIVFPIIANAVRVFGIIVIGHASDMEHAVGADHLIYGWFFFAFVIICLLGIGELVRRYESKRIANSESDNSTLLSDSSSSLPKSNTVATPSVAKLSVVLVLLLAGIIKTYSLNSASAQIPTKPLFSFPYSSVASGNSLNNWVPEFNKTTLSELKTFNDGNTKFNYYLAYFDGTDGELVSAQHNIYSEKRWSLAGKRSHTLENGLSVTSLNLKSSRGGNILVNYVYVIDGLVFTNDKKAKLYQVWLKLQGKPYDGVFFAVSEDLSSEDKPNVDVINQKPLLQGIAALETAFQSRD